MITLDINGDNLTINGLNENDIWGLEVIDGNFMLSKYNGIAKSETESVKIITFPNLGETYGKIKLYLNEKQCYETIILNESQYITPKYFSVEPKEIIFNKKGETAIINVFSSDIDWNYDKSLDGISLSDDVESITVESNTNDNFKYDLTVFNEKLGAYETVRLIQGSVDDLNSNTLIVSPTYVFVSKNNKTFNVHVKSLCNNSTDYSYKSNTNDIEVVKNGNLLKCEVTEDTFKNGEIVISNNCDEIKTVNVVYLEENEDEETYIYIVRVDGKDVNSATTYTFIFEDTDLHKFDILSNRNWKCITNDDNLSLSKFGETLNASLNNLDNLSGKIILKTDDNKQAIINYKASGSCEETTLITYSDYKVIRNSGDSVECNEKYDDIIVTATKKTEVVNSFCVTTSSKTEYNVEVNDFKLSYSPNTDNNTSSDRLVTCTVKSNNGEVIGEFTYTQNSGETCFNCQTSYTSVVFDCRNIDKCETTVSVTDVKAVGTYTCTDGSTGNTSTTLSQDDYMVIVSPPEITENTTSNERKFTVTVTSNTLNISGEKIITQAPGPCKDVYVFETVLNPLEGVTIASSGVTNTQQGFLSTKNGEYCPITATPNCNWITIDNISSGTVGDNGNVVVNISFAANETKKRRTCSVKFLQDGSNKEIIHSFTQEGEEGCDANIVYHYLTVTVSTVSKCDTSASFMVIANGTYTDELCETGTTSSTLTYGNYEVKYGTSSGNYTLDNITANETTSAKTWYYKITTTSSIYNGLTYTGSFTQAPGPCKSCETSSTFVGYSEIENTTNGYDNAEVECNWSLTKNMLTIEGYPIYNVVNIDCSTGVTTSTTKTILDSSEYSLTLNPTGNNTTTSEREIIATIKYGDEIIDTIKYIQKTGSTCIPQYELSLSETYIESDGYPGRIIVYVKSLDPYDNPIDVTVSSNISDTIISSMTNDNSDYTHKYSIVVPINDTKAVRTISVVFTQNGSNDTATLDIKQIFVPYIEILLNPTWTDGKIIVDSYFKADYRSYDDSSQYCGGSGIDDSDWEISWNITPTLSGNAGTANVLIYYWDYSEASGKDIIVNACYNNNGVRTCGKQTATGAIYTPPQQQKPYISQKDGFFYLYNPLAYAVKVKVSHVVTQTSQVVDEQEVTHTLDAKSNINLTWPTTCNSTICHNVSIISWEKA